MGHRHRLVVAGLVVGLQLALPGVAQAAEGNGLIAFVRGVNGKAQIFVMRSDGGGVARISDGTASDNDPAWSPDGTRIAFESSRTGDGDIYVMNTNGTGVTKVTGSGAEEAQPTWSPDGTTIAYARCTTGCSIWSIHVDGTNATRLTYGWHDR